MFDASWADTSSETVAQRRSRKNESKRGETPAPSRNSIRSSKSSGSSSKSHSKSTKINHITGSKKSVASNVTQFHVPENDSKATVVAPTTHYNGKSSLSCLRPRPDSLTLDATSVLSCTCCRDHDMHSTSDTVKSAASSIDDSVFSQWIDHPSTSESSWCGSATYSPGITTEIQRLSSDSSITRTTEVIVSRLEDTDTPRRYSNKVCISSDGALVRNAFLDDDEEQTAYISGVECPGSPLSIQTLSDKQESFVTPAHSPSVRIPQLSKKYSMPHPGSPVVSPTRATARNRAPEIAPSTVKCETWKAPESWECPSDISQLLPHPKIEALSIRSICPPTIYEDTHLDRHIMKMSAANPKIMLERLKEQWPETADATVAQDLEIERQMWMLMSLRYLTERANGERDVKLEDGTHDTTNKSTEGKILSLHDTQASVSIIIAFNTKSQVHHLSTESTTLLTPRYHPLTVPIPLPTLPYATASFQQIHSMTLPTLLQTPQIPALLRECHRILSATGSIHLTLLSPLPTTSTTGPLLRLWLEGNVLPNIEAQFRCTQPSRIFPTWLADAGFDLSHTKSRIRPVRFWALGPGEGGKWDRDGWNEASRGVNALTAVVGRMLWKEFYGGFVRGTKWWWEEAGIVEECGRLGTRWDCEVLDVYKQGS